MSTTHITDHFMWSEAACHDGTAVPPALQPNARRVAATAELIRDRFGGPLVAVSWYRTPEYNVRVGGVAHSRHMEADAIDMRPADLTDLPRLKMTIRWMIEHGTLPELGGYGEYDSWVHIDTRPRAANQHVARWYGRGVGAEG